MRGQAIYFLNFFKKIAIKAIVSRMRRNQFFTSTNPTGYKSKEKSPEKKFILNIFF